MMFLRSPLIGLLLLAPLLQAAEPPPSKWESAIAAFEAQDKKSPPPAEAVLFVGSSSIRLWDLASSFPGVATINRGFGGSQMSDVVEHAGRIVLPYKPRTIVLYEGDNDLAANKTPEQVAADFDRLLAIVRAQLPATPMIVIGCKPSPKRWALIGPQRELNRLLAKRCAKDSSAKFVDVERPMLDASGQPKSSLFKEDQLHLNADGYALWSSLLAPFIAAKVQSPSGKPVPRMQVIPLPGGQASVQRDGQEISRYWFGPDLRRPFLFPLVGPSGRSLTRMGHPRDPNGHSHHNSVWVTHHDVGGVAFWNDAQSSKGRIVHRRVLRYEDTDDEALIEVVNAWQDDAGQVLLEEQRAMRFRPQDGGQWLLVLDLTFTAPKAPVTLGKTNFGMIGVRMAKTIGVHDGGGTIRNSEGGVNEAGVHEKPARWCDYSGPITREASEGITLLDHPANPNHPTVFHVRDDGWMGAALTFAEPRTIEPAAPLKLRYGLWIHAGVPAAGQIEREFGEFAKIGELPPAAKQ